MADINPKITITATDQATPTFERIIAGLQRLEQAGEANAAWITQLSTLLGTQQQAAQATTQSTNQLASAYVAMAQAIQQQTQAYTQANAALIAHQQQQAQLREALQQQQQATQAATGAWQQMLTIAGGVGIATSLGAIVSQMTAFAKSVIDVGARLELLRVSLNAVTGGTQQGAQAYQFITDTAQKYGFSLLSLSDNFKQLSAATRNTSLEGEQTRKIFDAVSAAARTLGASNTQVHGALLALEQMVSKGTVSMEELRRQLGNALPGAFEIAARAMGVTTQGLTAMVKSGQLLSEDFLPKFAAQLQKELGEGAVEAAKTATAAFARLENEWLLLKDRIAKSGPLQFVATVVGGLASSLEKDRLAAEALTAALDRLARRTQVEVAPGARLRPGTLEGQTPAEEAQLRALEQQRVAEIARGRAVRQPSGFLGINPQGILPTADELEAQQQRIITTITGRRTAERGVAARRAGVDEDVLTRDQEAAKSLEAGIKTAHEALKRLFDEGQKQLKVIDLDAQLTPSLDVADEKLKSWERTLKEIRKELNTLSEPVRRALLGADAATASPWRALIAPIAAERGIDPLIIEALIAQESGNNPKAVSRTGAKGLGQFMPATAAQYGIAGREFDPQANIRATVNYLADLLKQFGGDINKALTAYNAGPGRGGIPLATGENATFARDVLARIPTGGGGILAKSAAQLEALRAGVSSDIPDKDAAVRLHAETRAEIERLEAEERAIAVLKRLASAYSETKEERAQDTAELLKAKFPLNALIQEEANRVISLAATRAAYKEEVEALNQRYIALKQAADATREAEQAQTDYLTKLRDTLAVLQAPKEERAETQLRALAARQGVTVGPQEEAVLMAITAAERARSQAREMEGIANRLAGNIRQTFDNLWEQIFTGGVTSFRQLGEVVVQSLQKMFAQLTSQIMNTLLNAAAGTTEEKGGWAGVLARAVVGIGTTAANGAIGGLGGGGIGIGPGSEIGTGTDLATLFSAGGNVFPHGLGTIRMLAGGGVVDRPSFTTLAEYGQPEAVVPLSGDRKIPVEMRGQQAQQQQPIVIEIHNDYTNAVSPNSLKTGKKEIIQHIVNDYRADGPIRRTFKAG